MLSKYRYSRALDYVVHPHFFEKKPDVTCQVLQELMRQVVLIFMGYSFYFWASCQLQVHRTPILEVFPTQFLLGSVGNATLRHTTKVYYKWFYVFSHHAKIYFFPQYLLYCTTLYRSFIYFHTQASRIKASNFWAYSKETMSTPHLHQSTHTLPSLQAGSHWCCTHCHWWVWTKEREWKNACEKVQLGVIQIYSLASPIIFFTLSDICFISVQHGFAKASLL